MNLIDVAKKRYSTKSFDPSKSIDSEKFDQIKALLRYAPSSVNSQPWHFVIASTPEGRKTFSKGTQGVYAFNETKVLNASHVILFCAKTDINENYLNRLIQAEEEDGRYRKDPTFKQSVGTAREKFVNLHRLERNDAQCWMEKQIYLNMGTVLLGAGVLGIDAVPIEGLDCEVLNKELKLTERGYTAVAFIALGYRSIDDFNAALPKSRLPEEDLISYL